MFSAGCSHNFHGRQETKSVETTKLQENRLIAMADILGNAEILTSILTFFKMAEMLAAGVCRYAMEDPFRIK